MAMLSHELAQLLHADEDAPPVQEERRVGSALEESMGPVPAAAASSSPAASSQGESSLSLSNEILNTEKLLRGLDEREDADSILGHGDLWDLFWSGEAVVTGKQWPWSRLRHEKRQITIYWNERDNIVQSKPPKDIFSSHSRRYLESEEQGIGGLLQEYRSQLARRRKDVEEGARGDSVDGASSSIEEDGGGGGTGRRREVTSRLSLGVPSL
jgi:hypothetical protein